MNPTNIGLLIQRKNLNLRKWGCLTSGVLEEDKETHLVNMSVTKELKLLAVTRYWRASKQLLNLLLRSVLKSLIHKFPVLSHFQVGYKCILCAIFCIHVHILCANLWVTRIKTTYKSLILWSLNTSKDLLIWEWFTHCSFPIFKLQGWHISNFLSHFPNSVQNDFKHYFVYIVSWRDLNFWTTWMGNTLCIILAKKLYANPDFLKFKFVG